MPFTNIIHNAWRQAIPSVNQAHASGRQRLELASNTHGHASRPIFDSELH